MRHKIGDLVYHPTICDNGSLGEIVKIRHSKTPEEASWFGDDLYYYVDWHERLNWEDSDMLPTYSEADILIMKRWLNEKVRKDAT